MSTTKRITKRLLAVVLTVMMLMSMVTIGITSASAASVELATTGANVSSGTVIYFDNSTFGWTNKVIQLMIGHSSWSQGYQMTNLNGTDLYYVSMPSWDGATQLCVFGADSVWGGEGSSISNRKNWAPNSTPIYSLSSNISGTHLLTTTSSALSKTTLSAYSALNTTQTISALVNGEAATDAATFTASSYNLTGKTASAASSGTTTVSAARTADVTMTAAANEGYTFLGWSTDGTSVTSADATYTYTCDGTAKTVYALFETAAEESSSSTGEVESQPTTTEPTVTDPAETNGTAMDASAWFTADGLYAYASVATGDELGPDAWQRWDNVSGHSANRYIYLPASASDTEVVIYNNYSDTVELNDVKIDAGCYAIVPYVNGTTYTCSGATTQTVKIMKSDAEGTLFINSADGMKTVDDSDNEVKRDAQYDVYSFLTSGSKNQEAGKLAGAVASDDGVIDYEVDDDGEMIGAASVKKIKGRGNSTWGLAKKPFNITFNKNIEIDGMKGKKWSLLANAQDPSLIRNRLVYDLANEVHMTYACDSRFVDWFVNGDYKGSYQLTQKIELGKNTVMPDLEEPEVEDVIDEETGETISYPKENFDFILELDTEKNAQSSGDLGFTTTGGQWMTYKTPDEPAAEQEAFMKAKYQAVEDALYGGDIATLETLVDLDDFARAYLVNEVAKNLDAGVTSCYFTYNSETGMFTTAPVWDYDNALGNSISIADRHDANGTMLDVTGPTGWYARDLMHYDLDVLNVFGQACATTTTNAAGETFNDVVLRIWNDEFMPALAVLEGTSEATEGRLNDVAAYMTNLKNSGQWNYDYAGWDLTANNGWVADHSSLTMYDYDAEANTYTTSTKSYDQYTLDGQANYAGDWLISRMNWMAAQYAEAELDVPDGYITIYFENNWKWPDAKVYYWGSTTGTNPEWNGISLTNVVGQNDQGYDIYEIVIPADITGLLFNGTGEYGAEQSADITSGWYEGICYYMTYDSATNTKPCGSYDYKVPEETTSAPVESDPAESTPAATSDETTPAETTTAPAETTSAPAEEAETITIYFENNWAWPDAKIYYWGSTTGENPAWEGIALTNVVGQNDAGYDIYEIVIPADITGIIFNGTGEYGFEQSTDITEGWYDGICYYMTYDSATNTKPCGTYDYNVPEETTTATATVDESDPAETTTAPAETTAPASGDEPDMPTVITVYAINSAKWDEVYAYCWATDPAVAWPGVAMDKTEDTVNGFDVYALSFDSAYVNVIFNNNNNGSQTADLTAMDGQYYDIKGGNWYASLEEVPGLDTLSTDRYLVGEFNSWSTTANEFKLKAEGESYGYVTLTLDANTTYEFKIVREGTWTSCTTPITATVEGLTFSSSNSDNCTITTTEAGEYVFAFGINNSQLSVTYPGSEVITPTTPDEEETDTTVKLAGDFTEWGTNAIEMTADENGTVYTTELYLEANTYEFKMIEFGKWLGNNGSIENTCEGWTFRNGTDENGNEYGNCTLVATGGTYTFTFDTATDKLTVTAVLDPIVTPVCDIVFLNEGNHYTHDAPATVDEGSSFQFTITPEENYKVVAVIADMMELAPDENGVYTCEDVSNCVQIMVFLTEETSDDTPIIPANTWTVMFVDDNNNIIAIEKVTDGESVAAPEAPEKAGYTFTGWSADTSNVQADMIVVAQYKKIEVPVEPATIGRLQVEVSGGTGVTVNGRPQGTSYLNTKMTIGTSVTLVAKASSDATFVGWLNASNNLIITTDTTYTFTATGNDSYKALYLNDVEGVNVVRFMNDKSKQILDMQYYAAGETIVYPEYPTQAGFKATGWNMTDAQIQAQLEAGNDVTVSPTWERVQVFVNVSANGGTLSNGNGSYLLTGYVTATANAPETGMKFAYWVDQNNNVKSYDAEYSFFAVKDTELTAVYVAEGEEIEYKILVNVDAIDTVTYDTTNATYYSWYVPTTQMGIKYVKNGVISVNKKNYNEATFVAGSTDSNVYDRGPSGVEAVPVGSRSWTKSNVAVGDTWMSRAYVQYTIDGDPTGTVYTVYSDIVEATRY